MRIPYSLLLAISLVATLTQLATADSPPRIVEFWPSHGATGVLPNELYYVEVRDADQDLDPDSVQYTLNGEPCRPLIKPVPEGYRFLLYPQQYLPLQTIWVSFSISDRSRPPHQAALNYSFVMSRWESGTLIPGFDGHPIYGVSAQFEYGGLLHLAINDDHRLLYATYLNGELSETVLVDTNVWKSPILRRDLVNTIHLAWFSMAKGGVLRYTNNYLGYFSPPVEFPVWFFPYSESMPFDMVVDFMPVAHLVWTEEAWVDSLLYYAATTLWLPPTVETVNENRQPYMEPRVALNFANQPHIIWRAKEGTYNQILWTRKTDANFSQPTTVTSTAKVIARSLQIHVGDDAVSRIAWEEWPQLGPYHYLAYASDSAQRGVFDQPAYLGRLPNSFRIASKALLFPNRSYYLCHDQEALYFTCNETGTFGLMEKVGNVAPAGAAIILGDSDNLAVLLHGEETGGLRVIEGKQPRHRPVIISAGWGNSSLSARAGGTVTLTALVYDAGADLDRVELLLQGATTWMKVPLVERLQNGLNRYELSAEVQPGLTPGEYLIELAAFDEWGQASAVWPRFDVVPSPDIYGKQGAVTGMQAYLAEQLAAIEPRDSTPVVATAGFLDSRVTTVDGGVLVVAAAIKDRNRDLTLAALMLDEQPIALLNDAGKDGDAQAGDGVYCTELDVAAGVPFGSYSWTIIAIDEGGRMGTWPKLVIQP